MKTKFSAVHAGFRQLGITDDSDKRAIYARVTGQPRLSLMTPAQVDGVLQELRRLGFRPAAKRANGRRKLSGRYAGKLQALWIAAYNLGVVDDSDDGALEAFVKRQTGLSSEKFLHIPEDAAKVVEALKSWMTREAGIDWNRAPQDWLAADGARIAWAQWKKLIPTADLVLRRGFDEVALAAAGRAGLLVNLTAQDWIAVMNALGKRIRQVQKKAAA